MLLLLHGSLYTKDEFDPLTAVLAERFTIDAINFTGHGPGSVSDEPFSISLFADDVLRRLESVDAERVDIFGFSMGGYVGLYLAGHYPKKIGRVMTLGTKLRWDPQTAAREVMMLDPQKIEEKVPRFAEVLKRRHGDEGWKSVLKKTAEMMTNLGNAPELSPEGLQQIEQPVRLTLGDRDHMVSIEETVETYRLLPNGELNILPGIGHPLEKVPIDLLIEEITGFFTPRDSE